MGFSDAIYYAETGLDADKVQSFVGIVHENGVAVRLRYICTPLTLTDVGNFIDWASSITDSNIFIDDCQTPEYLDLKNNLGYWTDTIGRCRDMFLKSLYKARRRLEENNTTIHVLPKAAQIMNFDAKTCKGLKLDSRVRI